MPDARARLAVAMLIAVSLVAFRGPLHGDQRYDDPPFLILPGVGLPAVNVGLMQDESHAPDAPEALHRVAIRAGLRGDDGARPAASFRPGRLIVKFRDEAPDVARLSALHDASTTGTIAERASHADFDVVHLSPDEDPVTAARLLMDRHGDVVEYAQPSYRMHTMFTPNDPLYAANQWNLPMIDLERAWDIQPAAGSSITVAVVDSGLAYQDAMIIANVPIRIAAIPRSDASTFRTPRRGRWFPRRIPSESSRRTILSGTAPRSPRCRSTSTAMARTSAARSAS